ncbi:MAG: hypothetical protein ABSD03_15920 [Vulcanimicrobiaceae bacterium]
MMHTRTTLSAFIAVALCGALLAGCGGGSSVPATGSKAPQQAGRVPVTFRIDVPSQATTSKTRSPRYISPATTQLAINIEQDATEVNGYPITVGLTPTSGGCTSSLASTYCQLTVTLVVGNYTATLTAQDANGNALSGAQSIAFAVANNATNVIAIVLSGIPHSLQIASGSYGVVGSASAGFTLYGAAPQPVIVTALDADGNTIVGPGSPTYSASPVSGSGWGAVAPTSTAPNTIVIDPPGTNGSGATFVVTASYPDSTCSFSGAVCRATFTMKSDVQTLFVANSDAPSVTEYTAPYTGTPTTISNGVTFPSALVFDRLGNLFVANSDSNTVGEYAPPYTGTPTIISSGMDDALTIALNGAAEDLFVANAHVGTNTVTEYAPPYSGAPTTITSGLDQPFALAVDSAGNLFVANFSGNTVTEYAPPYTGAPTTTISLGVNQPYALAIDGVGNLFVANFAAGITIYAPPYTGSPTTITSGVSGPIALVVDGAGNLFVGNYGNSTVTQYARPYSGAHVTVSNGVNQPYAVAVDGADNLYVANFMANTVTAYAPPYVGTPITIGTGVVRPTALLFTP